MDIKDVLHQIFLSFLTFIALQISQNVSIWCARLLFGVCYYVNIQFTPQRVINIFHYAEQNLSLNVNYYDLFTSIQNSMSLEKSRSLNASVPKLILKKQS